MKCRTVMLACLICLISGNVVFPGVILTNNESQQSSLCKSQLLTEQESKILSEQNAPVRGMQGDPFARSYSSTLEFIGKIVVMAGTAPFAAMLMR
ncbi:MAG: hypothetical protein HY606_02840 [Planctomycetes bacterium]|nr:hypothetical protein [Planctomycetota bacterium]